MSDDSKIKQFFNTADAIARSAFNGGSIFATAEVVEARAKVCATCPEFDGTKCAKCGCYMKRKGSLSAAGCPLKKWEK